MNKEQIQVKLLKSLDLELTRSGLEETDLDFQNYIIKKFGVTKKDTQPLCFECGKPITEKEYIHFKVDVNEYIPKIKEVYLDFHCLFKEYILPVLLERSRKYWN